MTSDVVVVADGAVVAVVLSRRDRRDPEGKDTDVPHTYIHICMYA